MPTQLSKADSLVFLLGKVQSRSWKPARRSVAFQKNMSSDTKSAADMLGKTYERVPKLLYGTAWKKERTDELVYQALKAGFRGIDTAAQPRHYQEDLVGKGIKRAINDGILSRDELFLQTKFTPISGQDPGNMPYDASLPIPDQIHTSIASSLKNFALSDKEEPYIDTVLLHSPLPTLASTQLAWQTLETYVPHKIRSLGISNVPLSVLQTLLEDTKIKPLVVQNRFYPDTKWEVPLRKLCRENDVAFEGFWTLTANPHLMRSEVVRKVALELQKFVNHDKDLISISFYALVLGLEGVSILNGTTKTDRMANDLETLALIERLKLAEWKDKWEEWAGDFRSLIKES